MNRRNFFGRFIKAAAVVTVAPMAIAAIVPKPFVGTFSGETLHGVRGDGIGDYESVRYNGRTYHFKRGIDDAIMRHKVNMEHALLFGDMKYCIPQGNGIMKFIKV